MITRKPLPVGVAAITGWASASVAIGCEPNANTRRSLVEVEPGFVYVSFIRTWRTIGGPSGTRSVSLS